MKKSYFWVIFWLYMRSKLKEENKKRKMSLSIDNDLMCIFDNYMNDIGNSNKTKYIEKLIKDDLICRGLLKNNYIE